MNHVCKIVCIDIEYDKGWLVQKDNTNVNEGHFTLIISMSLLACAYYLFR